MMWLIVDKAGARVGVWRGDTADEALAACTRSTGLEPAALEAIPPGAVCRAQHDGCAFTMYRGRLGEHYDSLRDRSWRRAA